MNLCVDCVHVRGGNADSRRSWQGPWLCGHPELVRISPVDGSDVFRECADERQIGCGPLGDYFEAKPVPVGAED